MRPSLFMKRVFCARRVAGALLLVAVFFLPLHFHFFTAVPQVSKECSCYQGGRTQAAPAPVAAEWTPVFQPSHLDIFQSQPSVWFSISSGSIRAPPSL